MRGLCRVFAFAPARTASCYGSAVKCLIIFVFVQSEAQISADMLLTGLQHGGALTHAESSMVGAANPPSY